MIFLRYNLWKTKRALSPKSQFKRALWQKLDESQKYGLIPNAWYRTVWFRLSIAAVVGVVTIGSVSAGAYAYTSSEVTENSVLYSIKQKIEAVEEKMQRTPEAQARFYLKQLERREAEQKVLERGRQKIEKIEVKLESQIEKAENHLKKIEVKLEDKNDRDKELRQKVRERLQKRKEKLEERQEKAAELMRTTPEQTVLGIKEERNKNNRD